MAYASQPRRVRFAARNARAPQPRNDPDQDDGQSRDGETRPPSYLAQTRDDFTHVLAKILRSGAASDQTQWTGIIAELWEIVSQAIRTSFHNGVRLGAAGVVKPKERRERSNAEGD
jgi:hypothetical protein